MVLRGSKTKPEKDIITLKQAIKNIKENVQNIRANKSLQIQELSEMFRESTPPPQSGETQLNENFLNSLETIINYLEEFDKEEQKAQLQLEEYKKEIKIATQQLLCGGVAGASARTTVAPIDRVKLLIQTAALRQDKAQGMIRTGVNVLRNTGILSLWKGNGTNVIRVFPYAATQFMCYERYKSLVNDWTISNGREFGNMERLLSGGLAGATAATVTYPLDVIRVTTTVVKEVSGPRDAVKQIYNTQGMAGFYKGWVPTVLSLGPFIGINFASFDFLKTTFIKDGDVKNSNVLVTLSLGATAGLFAQSICYPLDTIRRNMQINNQVKGPKYNGILGCITGILSKDGIQGFYRGIVPNAIKIVPNNGIRFMIYSYLTSYLNIPTAKIRPKKRKD